MCTRRSRPARLNNPNIVLTSPTATPLAPSQRAAILDIAITGHTVTWWRRLSMLHPFALAAVAVIAGGTAFVAAQAQPAPEACTVTGTAKSGTTPLPGVSIVLSKDGTVTAATSTDESGAFRLRVPGGDYTLGAQLAAFSPYQGAVMLSGAPGGCSAALDVQLTLSSRTANAPSGPIIDAPGLARRPGRIGGNGRTAAAGNTQGGGRFAALQVQQTETAGAAGTTAGIDEGDPAARLLPPGFSANASTDVVAVSGTAANLDRGQLRDRNDALGRGEFGPALGDAPPGVAGGAPFAFGGGVGDGGAAGVGGPFGGGQGNRGGGRGFGGGAGGG